MSSPLPIPKTFTFKTTAAGLDLELDVYVPPHSTASSEGGVPVLLWFHIGALLFGSRTQDNLFPTWLAQQALERGWIFVSPDYRLMPHTHIEDILSDIRDAWSFIHTELNKKLAAHGAVQANLAQALVGGGSAGGYLALQGGHLFTPAPKAVGVLYPVLFSDPDLYGKPQPRDSVMMGQAYQLAYDLEPDIRAILDEKTPPETVSDPWLTAPDWTVRQYMLIYLVGEGTYFSTIFKGHSGISKEAASAHLWPQTSITAAYPPTFIGHGTADSIAPSKDSEEVASILAAHGVEHELALVPGAEHLMDYAFGESDEVLENRGKLLAFFERHLV